jgi:hypothetical protein
MSLLPGGYPATRVPIPVQLGGRWLGVERRIAPQSFLDPVAAPAGAGAMISMQNSFQASRYVH